MGMLDNKFKIQWMFTFMQLCTGCTTGLTALRSRYDAGYIWLWTLIQTCTMHKTRKEVFFLYILLISEMLPSNSLVSYPDQGHIILSSPWNAVLNLHLQFRIG